MPERAGGVERQDIDAGFRALAGAENAEEIERLIETMPVLRSPIFHAYFRQYRYANETELRGVPGAYEHFMEVYDHFFTHLHFVANYMQAQAEPAAQSGVEAAASRPVPPFFEAVRLALGSEVPAPDGAVFHPQSNLDEIIAAVARLTKLPVALAPWEPTPGALWSCVVVACGRCQHLRLTMVPYYLDLQAAPALLDALRAGEYEREVCPRCFGRTVLPLRIFIAEDPSPRDALGAICTLCRVRETEIILRPPPGTVRKADDDRILEVRMEMMIRQLDIRQPDHDGVILTNGIAYSLEELLWRIGYSESESSPQVDYQDIVAQIYQKLLSGLVNWQDTEQWIRKIVAGKNWAIQPAHPAGDVMKALVMNLVAEACAEDQKKPPEVRAALAGLVSQCFAIIGETARARIALARARDLAAKVPEDAGQQEALAETEAEILRAEGKFEEAVRIRRDRQAPAGMDPESQLRRAGYLQSKGLELRAAGRIREAMETLENGLSILRGLARDSDSEDVRNTLSGTLANLALLYSDCALNLETLAAFATKPLVFSDLPLRVKQNVQRLGSPKGLMAMQTEMAGPVSGLLRDEFGSDPSAAALRARAIALYREAIENGRDLGYLCIQTRALAEVLMQEGDLDGAADAAKQCIGYAARLRDYKYIGAAAWQLAGIARERGDVAGALEQLGKSLEAALREVVRTGSHNETALGVARDALRAGLGGGDVLTAVLLAESAKAIPTSISLIRAVPLQGEIPEPLRELSRQLELLQLRGIWEPGTENQQKIEAVQAAITTARRELADRDPRIASWHDATDLDVSRPAPFRRLLSGLGTQTTYAGYMVDGSSLFVYAVWADGQLLDRVDLPANGIPTDDLNALSALLLQPLTPRLDQLAPDDRLIISACPELEGTSFALVPFAGKPLCAHATISMVNGSGMFEACARRPSLAVRKAVALGAPSRPDVPELRGAVEEIEQITERLEGGGIGVRPMLTGAAATISALASRIEQADLIHFACHAETEGEGREVRLLLAPALLSKDSGILSEQRIFSDLRLKPGCHVNLAACRSAAAGGEGDYYARGLVTAFLVAGASSVVAALWPLADVPAAAFQSAYYERIAKGLSPAVALAGTQRAAFIGELGEELRLPQNFGGYVLYGAVAK